MSMFRKTIAFTAERPEDWRVSAACRGHDPELWQPVSSKITDATREAKRICRACPVRDDCLKYALREDGQAGIWGGLTEDERHKMKQPKVKRRGDPDFCTSGHPWNDENTYWRTGGGRECRVCRRAYFRKIKAGAR